MKFKKRNGDDWRSIKVSDADADYILIEAPGNNICKDFCITVNEGDAVLLSPKQVKKIALALLKEADKY